jgi:YegS/Rv2252/BmrU family lipid kinase
MRACVIFNPAARGAKARRFLAALQNLSPRCVLRPTQHPGHASELAADACREGFDTIIAAGGDGTVSEVVDGLARAPATLKTARLGVIPLGTINVFARELGLPRRPDAAWRLIQTGGEVRVDLPCVEMSAGRDRVRRHFIQLGGAGLDSRTIERVKWRWKQWLGPLAYILAGLRAMAGPQPRVAVSAAGQQLAGELVLVGNGRYYGGNVTMFPGANLQDGLLDARVFARVTVLTLACFAWVWLARRTLGRRWAAALRAERLEVTCAGPLPVEVDGDNVGRAPAVFTVRKQALRVLARG